MRHSLHGALTTCGTHYRQSAESLATCSVWDWDTRAIGAFEAFRSRSTLFSWILRSRKLYILDRHKLLNKLRKNQHRLSVSLRDVRPQLDRFSSSWSRQETRVKVKLKLPFWALQLYLANKSWSNNKIFLFTASRSISTVIFIFATCLFVVQVARESEA